MLRVVGGLDDAVELRAWLSRQPRVAVDTETTGVDVYRPDFKVRLVQIGTATEAWVIPAEGWEGFIDQLFREYPGRILVHNSAYDVSALARAGVTLPWHKVDDTMIALRLAAPHQSAALKSAAKLHVSSAAADSQADLKKAFRVNKWTWATVPIDFPRYVFYAAMDVVLTSRLADTPICREGFASPLYRLEMDMRAVCTKMEAAGMRVDLDFCRESSETLTTEVEHRKTLVRDTFDFEVTSPTQLAKWLMTNGARIRKVTGSGAPSTDRESLEQILAETTDGTEIHAVVTNALRVRDLSKLSSSYFDNFMDLAVDGLLHPSIETIAARTGRSSIRNPALQTLPRGDSPDAKLVRKAVIPRNEGELLVSSDFEQIELRLIAALSEDPGLVEAFRSIDAGETDADFFTLTAREAFDDPTLDKSDPRRSLNKTLWYASCPTPDTLILCDDLVWRPAGDIPVGTGLWAFDEFKNDHPHPRARARRWRNTEVTHTDITPRECVRIVMESGRELTCAWDHHWLTQHATHGRSVDWKRSADLRPGFDALPRYIDTWDSIRTYEAGWLAGMFDGEGHLSGGRWNLSQLPGPIGDQIRKTLIEFGLTFSESMPPGRSVNRFYSTGGRIHDDMALLGAIRATRLIGKYVDQLEGKLMWRLPEDRGGRDVVVAVEKIGVQPTVTLQTGTHTYIAEGYGAHNSYGAGNAKMAAAAGVPEDEMRTVAARVFRRYPGPKKAIKVMERHAIENDNWIETPMGRRIWIDPEASYKALNARIQGHAADLFKQVVVDLAQAGLDDYLVVPVHDEVIFSLPSDIIEDVAPLIEETMTRSWDGVALPAAPSPGAATWGDVEK